MDEGYWMKLRSRGNDKWILKIARGSTVEMFIVGAIAAVDSVVPLNGSETQTFVNVNMKQVQF